jgi:hypothetical protein
MPDVLGVRLADMVSPPSNSAATATAGRSGMFPVAIAAAMLARLARIRVRWRQCGTAFAVRFADFGRSAETPPAGCATSSVRSPKLYAREEAARARNPGGVPRGNVRYCGVL